MCINYKSENEIILNFGVSNSSDLYPYEEKGIHVEIEENYRKLETRYE